MTSPDQAALKGIDALLLVGGRGARLGALAGEMPKPLVEVGGRAFLDLVLDDLVAAGARRIIACAGYRAERIAEHLSRRSDAEFIVSAEPEPLGTGGALRYALKHVHAQRILVLNGDSRCEVDFGALVAAHDAIRPEATIVVSTAGLRPDAGGVALDENGCVIDFVEKRSSDSSDATYVNAGIYLFEGIPHEISAGRTAFSLEYDVLPALCGRRACMAFVVNSPVLDIGTPERLEQARSTAGLR